MSPDEIKAARARLGLSTNGLAEALRLGKGGGRTVRRWEAGDVAITGPASVAIELMLAKPSLPVWAVQAFNAAVRDNESWVLKPQQCFEILQATGELR